MPRHRIFVAREGYKVSCAHMTVFPDGRKERLHGHNYQIAVALELADLSFARMIDFAVVKQALADLCAAWRERTLIAARNPHYRQVRREAGELEFTLCGARYVLPEEDALLLPIENTSAEELAAHAAGELCGALRAVVDGSVVVEVEVTITESPGQGATVVRPL